MTDEEFVDEFGDICPYCDLEVPIPTLRDLVNEGQLCPHCFGDIGIDGAEREALIVRFEAMIDEALLHRLF